MLLLQSGLEIGDLFVPFAIVDQILRPVFESETRYLHDQAAVVQEYGAVATGHATQHKYEYGLGLLSFGTPTGLGLAREFYLRDPLGSVVHLVDATGTALAGYQYDAWGGVRRQHGASANPRQFTGHYRDVETGLQYFGARYYDDEQARFVSQDPNLGESGTPPSLHRYLYAHGNPLRFTDPTGFAAETAQEADQWLSEAKRDLKSITDRFEADIEAQGADAVAKYRAGPAAEAKLQQLGEEHRRLLQEAGLTDADLANPVMADRAKWGVALFKRDLDRWVSAEGAGAWRAYAATVAAVAAEAVVSPLELGAAAGTVAGKLDVGAEITAGEWVAAAGDVMAGVQGLGTVGKIGASALSRRAAQSSAAQLARGGVIKEARRTLTGAVADAARQVDDAAVHLASQRALHRMTREADEAAARLMHQARTPVVAPGGTPSPADLAAALRGKAGIQPPAAGSALRHVEPKTISFHPDFNDAMARAAEDTIYIRAVLEHKMIGVREVPGLKAYGQFDPNRAHEIVIRAGLSPGRRVNTLFHESHHLEVVAHDLGHGYHGVGAFMEEFMANIRGIQGEVLEFGFETSEKSSIRLLFESQGNLGVARRVYQLYRKDNAQFRFSWTEVTSELQRHGILLR